MYNFRLSFISDEDKMRDFPVLTKAEFLASYSYLSEEEYDETKRIADRIAEIKRELDALLKIVNLSQSLEYGIDRISIVRAILDGYNEDNELFDFNYEEICSTVSLDLETDLLSLCDCCEVYDDPNDCMVADGYKW